MLRFCISLTLKICFRYLEKKNYKNFIVVKHLLPLNMFASDFDYLNQFEQEVVADVTDLMRKVFRDSSTNKSLD